jgi:SAM-dependent methyltransferase
VSASRPGFDLEAGSSDFYVDANYYEFEFRNRKHDVAFYVDRYVEAGTPVLELGVGAGRIALRAVRKGAEVVGLDYTQSMLDEAALRRDKLPKAKRDKLELVQGDMRDFDLGRKFDLITCPFNAFQHMYTREDVERTLACVAAHLNEGGRFIVDVLVPDLDYLNRPAFKRYPGVRFKHPTHGVEYVYSEQSAYDPVTQINQMWFHYDRGEPSKTAPAYFCIQLSHRCFFPMELRALLHYSGFEVETAYGDFDGEPLVRDAESFVAVCKRTG